MKPAFTDLRQNHETVEKLKRALKGMDKPTLEALVLNGVFPEVCIMVLTVYVCVCVCVCLEPNITCPGQIGYQTLRVLPPELQHRR